MFNFADFAETHLAFAGEDEDYSDLENFNGFEDESDWEYDVQFGGEDSYLDSIWESRFDFWEGE